MPIVTQKFNIPAGNVLLNWDYSPYGSLVCPMKSQVECITIASKQLKKIKAKPSFFEPKNFGIPIHRGLISLVQMNALLRGRALVTVGEGSYQQTIAQTFIDHHRDPDDPDKAEGLHYGHLCIPRIEVIHELSNSLEPKC